MTNDVGHWRFRLRISTSSSGLRPAIAFGRAAGTTAAAIAATVTATAAVATSAATAPAAAPDHADLRHVDLHRLAPQRFVFRLLFGRQRRPQLLVCLGAKLVHFFGSFLARNILILHFLH